MNVLLDFELLAPGDRGVVIGLGAVTFTDAGAEPLLSVWPISVTDQTARTVDAETVAWWAEQAGAAVAEAAQQGQGPTLAHAVHALVTAVLDRAVALYPGLNLADTWRKIRWWAKPAAADLGLWLALLRQYQPSLARIFGKCRDCRTLWEAAELATGSPVTEDPPGPGEEHDPGADAMRSARPCSQALRLLSYAKARGAMVGPYPAVRS